MNQTNTPPEKDGPAETLRSGDLLVSVSLGVGNRDGDAYAVKTADGRCFLVLQADTYHNDEVFQGMGSTEHVEISAAAFAALANDKISNSGA